MGNEQKSKDLVFPIIVIEPHLTLRFLTHQEQLTTCTPGLLKVDYFERLVIVDSGSRKFRVSSANFVRLRRAWWQRPFFKPRIEVSLSLIDEGQVGIEEAKRLVLKCMNYKEIRDGLSEARNFEEVMAFLGKFMEPVLRILEKDEVWGRPQGFGGG